MLRETHSKLPRVKDPTAQILLVVDIFLDFYNWVRAPMNSIEDLKVLVTKVKNLQIALQEVFPEKSGADFSCVEPVLYSDGIMLKCRGEISLEADKVSYTETHCAMHHQIWLVGE